MAEEKLKSEIMTKHIFIICGEPSGDLHAAGLTRALREISPEVKISGVGGPLLRAAGAELFCDIKGLAVFGLFEALKKLPQFFALQKIVLQKIKLKNPDAIILVDFSGFNLRLARAINKTIPVIYYISPQVWASRPGRLEGIKRYVHKMIVFLKFEEEFYKKAGIEVEFVGHPLIDIVKPTMSKKEFLSGLGLTETKTTVALLPGSRQKEIENILPIMLASAELIRQGFGEAQFVIAKAAAVDWEIYREIMKKFNLEMKLAEGKTYDCLAAADFALVCSGTATLETAILEKPFCVIYKMGFLSYLLYRPQVKLPYIGMANIVAREKIVPEFIQFNARPKKIAAETLKIIKDSARMRQMRDALARVKSALGPPGAALRAGQIIVNSLTEFSLA